MNAEQLRANGWVETQSGTWQKGKAAVRLLEPSEAKPKKRIRQSSKPLLNKLEEEFACLLNLAQPNRSAFAQRIIFRLGNNLTYKPDFFSFEWSGVGEADMPTAFEVKGPYAFKGAFEKLKMFASLYPQIRVLLVWKENGRWQTQRVLS